MDKKQSAGPSYPWRSTNAGAMGVGQCPASPPPLQGNLKARVNHIEGKLKEPLPQPSGDCGMCRTCSRHTNQQEAMVSMLSTQSRILDSLQKNVLEIQRTLETVMRGENIQDVQLTFLMICCVPLYVKFLNDYHHT